MSEGSLVHGQGQQKQTPPACSRPFSILIYILCGLSGPTPHIKNQDTFSNHNLGAEREGHAGLSQRPRRKTYFSGELQFFENNVKTKPFLPGKLQRSHFHSI